MASLQGHVSQADISSRLYRDIMSIPSRRPRSARVPSAKSVSSHVSFDTPRNSASAKGLTFGPKASYSDIDVIKSRSWSGSKWKGNNSFLRSSSPQRSARPFSRSNLVSPATPQSGFASPVPYRSPSPSTSRGLRSPSRGLGGSNRVSSSSSQVDRLHQEWAALERSRSMKRASEMVQHRLDPMYRLSGSNVPLQHRYHVNEVELQRLREMAETSRVLQHDLKRIRYPHTGPRTPRKEKIKSRNRSQPSETPTAKVDDTGDNSGTAQRRESMQQDIETSPAPPQPDAMHPSSPVSTPEDTPRQQIPEETEQQGEVIPQETSEQGEATLDEEEEQADT